MTKYAGTLKVTLERIPEPEETTQEEWDEWCHSHDIHPFANDDGSRRGWIYGCHTYIRGAKYLVYWYGYLMSVADEEDIKEGILIVGEEIKDE